MNTIQQLIAAWLGLCLVSACGDPVGTATAELPPSSAPNSDVQDTSYSDTGEQETDVFEPVCPPGESCEDGDPCTKNTTCDEDGETCTGDVMDCNDGLPCTSDTCNSASGCMHELDALYCLHGSPAECYATGEAATNEPCQVCGPDGDFVPLADGAVCEDYDACTPSSTCESGNCIPDDITLCEPDGNPCTSDECEPLNGCLYPPNNDDCDDGDPCSENDQCAGGVCAPGTAIVCDDGDLCTTDSCIEGAGCYHEQTGGCVDSDPCTADVCSNGNCTNTPFDGPCEDGNPCTSGEACDDAICSGGMPTICDDGNACTEDVCEQGVGCVHYYSDGEACSDGYFCTYNDVCVVGQCLGTKVSCADCPTPSTGLALKIVELTVATDGNAGSGLDVDENPTTCAPAGNCSGGVDNALSVIASLLNPGLGETIDNGIVQYVADFSQLDMTGQPFPFSVLETEQSEASAAAGCDFQNEECDYITSQFSYGPTCKAYFGLEDATWSDGTFNAGGLGYVMTIALRLSGNIFIPITLVNARVKGQITLDSTSTNVMSAVGIFAGATPKQQLIDSITNLNFDDLPIDKDTALSLLDLLVVNDIDLDGNGEPDGASIAIRFVGIGANLQ